MKAEKLEVGNIIFRAYISPRDMSLELYQYEVLATYKSLGKSVAILSRQGVRPTEYSDDSVYSTLKFGWNQEEAVRNALEELEEAVKEKENELTLYKEALEKFRNHSGLR